MGRGAGASMKLFLHAGIHRTGTTSLQHFLAETGPAARARRRLSRRGDQPPVARLGTKARPERGKAVLALVEAAGAEGAEQVVLSGEDFAIHTDLGWLREVATRHDTRAVLHLRRQITG